MSAKTDIGHLNDALHRMLSELVDPGDENGKPLDAEAERALIARAGAVSKIASQIIATGQLAIEAERLRTDVPGARVPRVISGAAEAERPRLNGGGSH